jgi:EF-hand domain pair
MTGNGQIDFDEFVAMLARRITTPQEEEIELQESFRVFDKNGDGFISTSELRQVIINLGEVPTDDELEAMIREADVNGDGRVDYNGRRSFVLADFAARSEDTGETCIQIGSQKVEHVCERSIVTLREHVVVFNLTINIHINDYF